MASPSPRPVVRFSAKIDTEPTSLASRRPRNVPTMASAPTSRGSSAATMLRKNSSESANSSGKASNSARWRSDSTVRLVSEKATARPPRRTPGIPSKRFSKRSAASRTALSDIARKLAATYVERPSRATNARSRAS